MSNDSIKSREICADFFPRLIAYGIDCLLFYTLWSLLVGFSFAADASAVFFHLTLKDVLFYLVRTLLFALCLVHTGSTPGKRIMRLRVIASNGAPLSFGIAFYRESVGRYLSTFIAFLGYAFILFHREKQALHDIISDTLVVYLDADTSVFETSSPEAAEEDIPNQDDFFDDDAPQSFIRRPFSTEADDTAATDEANDDAADTDAASDDSTNFPE